MNAINEPATKEALQTEAIRSDIQRQLQWQLLSMNGVPTEIKIKLNLKQVTRCLESAIDAIMEEDDHDIR